MGTQSQIAWNLAEQYKGFCRTGAEYGNFLYIRGDSIQIKLLFVGTKLLFSCLFSSALTIHLTSCRGSSLVYVFTFSLTSLRILFTWIILLNERGLLMHEVIFVFRPLLDQPLGIKKKKINSVSKCTLCPFKYVFQVAMFRQFCYFPMGFINKNPYNSLRKK